MKKLIISLMSFGFLLTLILLGCSKFPTETEVTTQTEERVYNLTELEPLPPNPDIENEIDLILQEQGIEKGTAESIKNVKVLTPDEEAMYNISPPTESEIKSRLGSLNKSSVVEWPPPYLVRGSNCYPYDQYAPPGYKMVHTYAATICSDNIDRICAGEEILVDGNHLTGGGTCLQNEDFVSVYCNVAYPESEEHRVDNYASHSWHDSEAFLPDQDIYDTTHTWCTH